MSIVCQRQRTYQDINLDKVPPNRPKILTVENVTEENLRGTTAYPHPLPSPTVIEDT